MVMLMSIFMLFMVIGFLQSGIIHFFGLTFGILFGLALYPQMPEANVNQNLTKFFKILSVVCLGIGIVLALIV